jgi:two-component system phosphate regulon response regulator PhoB
VLQCGGIAVDISRHLVTVDGRRIDLTATEFKLLTTLLQRRGRVQTREQLLKDVWEYDSGIDSRTVDTHMRRLRKKLGRSARCLDTIRGVGYRLAERQ